MAVAVWTPTETGHLGSEPAAAPEPFDMLLEHLTDYGKERLQAAMAEAMKTPGPEGLAAVSRVLRGWWLTLAARHQPGYAEAMLRPPVTQAEAVYESTEELQAKLGIA